MKFQSIFFNIVKTAGGMISRGLSLFIGKNSWRLSTE